MTNYLQHEDRGRSPLIGQFQSAGRKLLGRHWIPGYLLLILPVLYLATLAHTLVLGDPTEYTFVANILGIAHPPGYAFITLLGKVFQMLIPFGSIPWRMHLLSAVMATLGALTVYGTVTAAGQAWDLRKSSGSAHWTALFAAMAVGTGVDFWQHAIHANPHIITAAFLGANLFFLTKWWVVNLQHRQTAAKPDQTEHDHTHHSAQRWLYLFCVSAGLGVTHHPLTVFAFPAYALFIVWVQPDIWRQWRTLLKMIVMALLGLSIWLYFPIRSPMQPAFGPATMNTLDGFLAHILARGLSESLPYYTWVEQADRALVFWTLLRLQYTWPILIFSLLGLGWLLNSRRRPLFILYLLAFLGNYGFIISLKAQDIMAYLLGPFLIVGLLAGIGLLGLVNWLQLRSGPSNMVVGLLLSALFLLGPIWQAGRYAPRISLQNYVEGQLYVDAVFASFKDTGQGAVLLNDWEHMTPLWYTRFVEERWPDESDVRPLFVSSSRTWLENVFDYLPAGPVYLSNFRREIVDAGFRLRPFGPFYEVVEPGDKSLPAELQPIHGKGGELELVGYSLPRTAVTAGDYVPLTLAMRTPKGTDEFYVPVVRVGDISFPFTTDSHLITPNWLPGEVIVERFDLALPHHFPGGIYSVRLDLKNLSLDQDIELDLSLGQLSVTGQDDPVDTKRLLANYRQRVGLVSACARVKGARFSAPWAAPITAQPGEVIHLTLRWQSLALAEESYTIFVHLIDSGDRPIIDNLDYTPLGGAFPTYLWIPKWLPDQQVYDPYRIALPEELPPGTYRIEVGLYEMAGKRRLHMADQEGNLIGDRYVLGEVVVNN